MKKFRGIKPALPTQSRITPGFERFDQKNHMVYRGQWDEAYAHVSEARLDEGRRNQIAKRAKGYSREDYAFLMASTVNTLATDFQINVCDSGGTSWSPLERYAMGPEAVISNLPDWDCDPAKNTKMLKSMALRFGAGDVGTCELDRRFVYSHWYDRETKQSYPIRFSDEPGYEQITKPCSLPDKSKVIPKELKYVLVFIYPMELQGIRLSPRLSHLATTHVAYSQISFTTMAIAEFIRGLGYNAIPSSNETALNIPLAINAGLGELSRNAKLTHPVFGNCCRISKVITDLPLVFDTPISFGIKEFCGICKRCAKRCPAKAISNGEMTDRTCGDFTLSNVTMWQTDHAKCREFWVTMGTNCGLCITNCPYNQPDTFLHRMKKSTAAQFPVLDKLVYSSMLRTHQNIPITHEEFWGW